MDLLESAILSHWVW